jgi:predicted nucleic acid-binding protein
VILVDTSVLVDALTGHRHLLPALTSTVGRGERLGIPALVLYEYLRGPRSAAEIAHQEDLLPADRALPFGAVEATIAARLYRVVPRARQRSSTSPSRPLPSLMTFASGRPTRRTFATSRVFSSTKRLPDRPRDGPRSTLPSVEEVP